MFNRNEALSLLADWQIKDPRTYDLFTRIINAVADNDNTLSKATFNSTIKANIGITFPNAQTPSTDPNTLDDYEEGTWIPVDGSGAALVFTYGSPSQYIKIGRAVILIGDLTYPATGSGLGATIAGLPFANDKTQHDFSVGYTSYANDIFCVSPVTTKTFIMFDAVTGAVLSNANLTGKIIRFSTVYITNQ